MASNQKNSFISLLEQIAIMNKNSVEILAQINNLMTATDNSVSIQYTNPDGSVQTYAAPTVANLKAQIDVANTNIKRMLGLEGSSYVVDGTGTKKVFTLSLNSEPFPISDVGLVTNFVENRNWFFESLMNPLLSVEIDLTGKLDTNVNKIISRRYIMNFSKNADGTLTTDGQNSLDYFTNNFLNRSDIKEADFLNWYTNPNNIGVVNNLNPEKAIDEQEFDLNLVTLNYKGIFTAQSFNPDTMNKKNWYTFDTLYYFDLNGNPIKLATKDLIALNKKESSTIYQVMDISDVDNRVELKIVAGYDPVPVTLVAGLKFYSSTTNKQKVNISVGFNEYNVLFVKPINTENNVVGSNWSDGSSFYTNDLTLKDSPNNQALSDFYNANVNDYGILIKDLGNRLIPTTIAVKPSPPILNINDYQVVKINRHLTDSASQQSIIDLNAERLRLKSQISAQYSLIDQTNYQLATNLNLDTNSKNNLINIIANANAEINRLSVTLGTTIDNILNSTADISVEPDFRIRGFFDIPQPQNDQNVIMFETQYRYSAKDGSINPTEAFTLNGQQITGTTTGYFSNWNSYVSQIRKRTYDASTETWIWDAENIENADTININQVDIPINPNEKVDFKIRSISEVGYPESLIYSDWSDVITIPFPDSLVNESLSIKDQNIVDSTLVDRAVLEVNVNLQNQGYPQHISTSKTVGQTYYSHVDQTILTSFLDRNNNNIALDIYLKTLTDRIVALEEQISNAKGTLEIYLVNGNDSILMENGSTKTILVECENYGISSGITTPRVYYNNIYVIKDYYLELKNASSSNLLGLLSDRRYESLGISGNTNTFYTQPNNQAMFVDINDLLNTQDNYQFVWFQDTVGNQNIYSTSGLSSDGDYQITSRCMKNILNSTSFNVGYGNSGLFSADFVSVNGPQGSLPYIVWSSSSASDYSNAGGLLATVHPYIENPEMIRDAGSKKVKTINANSSIKIPINIYFKFVGSTASSYSVGLSNTQSNILTRYLKIFVEPENSNRAYETTIIFNLRQHKIG